MMKTINGENIETKKKEIAHFNVLEIEVGTNSPMGGDSGHGGRTYLKIEDLGSTNLDIKIIGNGFKEKSGFELILEGDAECTTLIQALEFAVKSLKKMEKENRKFYKEKIEQEQAFLNSLNK